MNNNKIHFITYASSKFESAKKRLIKEAKNSNWFDSINGYGPNNLTSEFKNKHNNILNKVNRGAGFWIWKFDIIKQELEKMNENDYLIYCDAGSTINSVGGEPRFYEYINMLKESKFGIISFKDKPPGEKMYTIKQIFDYFLLEENTEIVNTGQIAATVLIMKKNQHLQNILKICNELLDNNNLLITDYYNNKEQYKLFKDNRHDQSILSIVRKIHGSIEITNESYPFKNNFPFWATRKSN